MLLWVLAVAICLIVATMTASLGFRFSPAAGSGKFEIRGPESMLKRSIWLVLLRLRTFH